LNGFRVWTLLVVALTLANYGFPLAQFLFLENTGVPAYAVQGP
jgi:cytochrome c oxidase subunit 1